jgi:hypothetical protein
VFLLLGLETTVTELGGGVDPLELNLLKRLARGMREQRFPQGHHTLLDTGNRALDDDEVILDLTIPGETTHRRLYDMSVNCVNKIRIGKRTIVFLVVSYSVVALASSSPFPIR